jgi:small conductance mechanosensitive channel
MEQAEEIVTQLTGYGTMIANSLYFLIGGMLVIFLLHRIATRFLYAYIKNKRIVLVIFGTLYVLVFVITALMVLRRLGYDVTGIGEIAIVLVLVGAVAAFFLVPFLPRLPFKLGHMIEVNGTLGIVESISTFHTQVRTFEGNIVFIPNALVMASRIINYHETPNRRIELKLNVGVDCDLSQCQRVLLDIMDSDDRVIKDPAPAVFVMNANAEGVNMTGYCWVANSDWLKARSDLWLNTITRFNGDPSVNMSFSKQEVLLSGEVSSA